jgi:hypothetical protein
MLPPTPHDSPVASGARARMARVSPLVPLLGATALALHVVTIGRYGYLGDELYYIDATRHLDFGYVEFAPLSIAILAGWTRLAGHGLAAIRVLPAVSSALVVVLTGLIARALGGGARAQALASLQALVAMTFLVFQHHYSPHYLDHVVWTAAALLLVSVLRRPERRRWLALGALLGLGLENREGVAWLGAGIGIGLLATRHRRLLATDGPWLAGGVALLLFAPYLAWQAQHGWPFFAFVRGMREHKVGVVSAAQLIQAQLVIMHPLLTPIWLAGLGWLLATRDGRPFAPLAAIYLVTLGILAGAGTSKAYYPAPAYPALLAAGAIVVERLADRLGQPRSAWLVAAIVALGGAVTLPFALPLLPIESFLAYQHRLGVRPPAVRRAPQGVLPGYFAGMQEWPEIVGSIGAVHRALPADERAYAAVFSDEYTDAAAVNVLGPPLGLPPAVSAHNSYAVWGPDGVDGRVLIAVGMTPEQLEPWYADVRRAGTLACRYCSPLRAGQPIYVARAPRGDFAAFFAAMRHYE